MDKRKYIKKRYELLKESFDVYKGEINLHTYSFKEAKMLAKALNSIGLNWINFGDLSNIEMLGGYYAQDMLFNEVNKKEIFRLTIDLGNAECGDRCIIRTSFDFWSRDLDTLLGNLDFKATMTKLKNIRKELKNE